MFQIIIKPIKTTDSAWTCVLARSELKTRYSPENTVRHLVSDSSAKVSENTSTDLDIYIYTRKSQQLVK